ncbi:multicopper oxidase family protein [Paralimibaculum aggregatum]|uniref:Multicopper oxidase family protein n=1 Tax=Paralimibaculum aggregatum TaxID=3036245 RepID=A0ABQ6LRK7_9RHOB|nr:multicopper oxidase family protein [Limibaculum sp. NKW23]GMG83815.1 multicopper oxidase family protein [Limibaculum sp. NKW23]
MSLTRRHFLVSAAATGLAPAAAHGAGPVALTAAEGVARLTPEPYGPTRVWAYDGTAPGPVIRLRRGGRVTRRLINALPQPTTVHWHGIRIANAMDGVPGVTQEAVSPEADFLYDFDANDAGTYWYHPHVRSWEQVDRGLSGALIVEEEAPPEVDRDEVLLLDDWRLDEQAQIHDSFDSMHDRSHAGRIGNHVTVNGNPAHGLTVRRHHRLRLRLVNAANARIFDIGLKGLAGWVAALDGQPLAVPEPMTRLSLAPAQRADLVLDVTEDEADEAFLISHERGGDFALTTLRIDGAARPARLAEMRPLPPNDLPPIAGLDGAATATLTMEGGAMGGMRAAVLDGVETDIRELVRSGRAWALNGVAGVPEAPLLTARLGQTVRIALVNDTAWPHAMHLHGHHFRMVGKDGSFGPLRDTVLLDRQARGEIAFVADNPGDWLFHCHMLEHAAAGMSTWLRVV